ncbi:hypothetical protein EDEG_02878 [Edhazardia aedis USNM 41457]|uniref:Uncharacterized protein n=1 Tax=Edhazardia aedis (strain USNM 41457) TaxID=1003232 RepID=J9DJD5_EDHAE|nr:hypothetical protein EDEG_02878 [Edhazardia aedis USNM 41457]|eukprot:EJW02725.1 hypothetical protein EDEG_02878 [Edhazardia aedis USNM 41457]
MIKLIISFNKKQVCFYRLCFKPSIKSHCFFISIDRLALTNVCFLLEKLFCQSPVCTKRFSYSLIYSKLEKIGFDDLLFFLLIPLYLPDRKYINSNNNLVDQ